MPQIQRLSPPPIPPKRWLRAGGYCRISSDPKEKRAGVENQQEDVTILGTVKEWDIVEWFIDNDTSASKGLQRHNWNRLLAKIESGELDAIAAWDQDRNWRMMSELEDLRKFFKKLGCKIPLATTGQGEVDLYTPTGVMMAQIKTAVSEHEIAMMRVRQRRAAKGRAAKGKPKWRRAFGYCATPAARRMTTRRWSPRTSARTPGTLW